ncbi:integrase [Haladaptatus sp. R4]|uniref:site-specific integrase n=1 Tax=Haladaptatus sp. R4 TaxID=1679489 RepID=UPI0007B4D318|nr:site-specific integrase [Haladaptatus sp. R4]KZN25590.1 integrase [Haladaptatus sp. R4]
MTADPAGSIERLRNRVERSDTITPQDRENILAFSNRMALLRSEYSDQRHEKLLGHITRMAEQIEDISDALDDRKKAEDVVRWINRNYDNEETNKDYRIAFRVFAKRVTDGDDTPDSIDWIPSGYSNNYDPAPNPKNMLRWEGDILPMVKGTRNSRDAALVTVAWDSGARPGELQSLTVGDVTDYKHGLQVTVEGKTGQRTVSLIPSVPYLQRWLTDHPDSGDPNAPLWSKLSSPDQLSNRMLRKALNSAADRAGVKKPVNLTNFRKSSASYLASQNVNQAHLEDHHGWTRGSKVAARYVSVFGGDSDREIARAHGLDVGEDEPDPIAPLECPRCKRETPRQEEFCVWCGQAVEPGAIETMENDQRETRAALLRLAQEDPKLLDRVEQLQDVMALTDEHPDLLPDAQRFVNTLRED